MHFCVHAQTLDFANFKFLIFNLPPFCKMKLRGAKNEIFLDFGMCICIGACQKHGFSSSSTFVKMLDPSYDFHDFCFLLMMCVILTC